MANLVAYPTTSEEEHANFDNEHVTVIRRSPPRAASATDTGLVETLSSSYSLSQTADHAGDHRASSARRATPDCLGQGSHLGSLSVRTAYMLMSSKCPPFYLDKVHPFITHLTTTTHVLSAKPGLSNIHHVFKLYVRRCILHAFQLDDWACVAAITSTTAFAALSLAVIEYGAGRHLENIALDDARIFYYVRSIMALKYN